MDTTLFGIFVKLVLAHFRPLSHSMDIISWGFGLVLRKWGKVTVLRRSRVRGRLTWVARWRRACLVIEWLSGRRHTWHQTSRGWRRRTQYLRIEYL